MTAGGGTHGTNGTGDSTTLGGGGRLGALAVVVTLAMAVGWLPALPASAASAPTTTVKPGSTPPPPASPSPTTTIAPRPPRPRPSRRGTPRRQCLHSRRRTDPAAAPGGAATPAATSGAAGFDPASSVPIDAQTTPTKVVYANSDGTKTAKISQAPVRFKNDATGKWTTST